MLEFLVCCNEEVFNVETTATDLAWDDRLTADWAAILDAALREDLGEAGDCTSAAVVPEDAVGRADVVSRQAGTAAGLAGVAMALDRVDPRLAWISACRDGEPIAPRQPLGTIEGPARAILAVERTLLNFLGRLSGIATLTAAYVERTDGARAKIYDTRKTTPGWRRLEKYAVKCGGGTNHRMGLDDAILIKDNHLALGAGDSGQPYGAAEAVVRAKRYAARRSAAGGGGPAFVEIEVATLGQLDAVLPAEPDIVLLDNFSVEDLREAVTRRDAVARGVELEASGGVNLETVRAIAETGVDRISVGALTHSAVWLDVGLDWR